jgi:excisionase family DNA binding protein
MLWGMVECWHCGAIVNEGLARRRDGLCEDCEYTDISQAAQRLHVSRSTIDRLLHEGRLTRVKPLSRVLIRRAEIEALLH